MTRRGSVLGLLLAAGLLGLIVSGQPWFTAAGTDAGQAGGGAGDTISFTGADATGGLTQALAAVVLAGVLLTLVLAVRGRRVVALLLAAGGLGMMLVGVLRAPPSAAAIRSRFRQTSLTDQFSLAATAWPWLYAVAGLLVLAGAVLLWIASPRWLRRTRRYDAPGTADPQLAVPESDDPAGAWRALDAGLDPTVDSDPDPAAGSAADSVTNSTSFDPDVRIGGAADTMGISAQDPTPRRKMGDQ